MMIFDWIPFPLRLGGRWGSGSQDVILQVMHNLVPQRKQLVTANL